MRLASIHSYFDQPRDQMAKRLVRACDSPYVNILGHRTTRRVRQRPPVDADWDAVFAACARSGIALEIAATLGTQLHLLKPGEPAAFILSALVTIVVAAISGALAVRAGLTRPAPDS